ncbi:hypothetical protein AAG570_007351 [Ranatra chinensis]|uniref:Uncharacterized protein n=1 Tax=Ranatra chinensis TaxID=642074 RepID=A0ABD0XVM1_9HEMI
MSGFPLGLEVVCGNGRRQILRRSDRLEADLLWESTGAATCISAVKLHFEIRSEWVVESFFFVSGEFVPSLREFVGRSSNAFASLPGYKVPQLRTLPYPDGFHVQIYENPSSCAPIPVFVKAVHTALTRYYNGRLEIVRRFPHIRKRKVLPSQLTGRISGELECVTVFEALPYPDGFHVQIYENPSSFAPIPVFVKAVHTALTRYYNGRLEIVRRFPHIRKRKVLPSQLTGRISGELECVTVFEALPYPDGFHVQIYENPSSFAPIPVFVKAVHTALTRYYNGRLEIVRRFPHIRKRKVLPSQLTGRISGELECVTVFEALPYPDGFHVQIYENPSSFAPIPVFVKAVHTALTRYYNGRLEIVRRFPHIRKRKVLPSQLTGRISGELECVTVFEALPYPDGFHVQIYENPSSCVPIAVLVKAVHTAYFDGRLEIVGRFPHIRKRLFFLHVSERMRSHIS